MNEFEFGNIIHLIKFGRKSFSLECLNSSVKFEYKILSQHAVILRERIYNGKKENIGIGCIGYSKDKKNEKSRFIEQVCYNAFMDYIEENVDIEDEEIVDNLEKKQSLLQEKLLSAGV